MAGQERTPWLSPDTWTGTAELRIANDVDYSRPGLKAKGRERTSITGTLKLKTVYRVRGGDYGALIAKGTWAVRNDWDVQYQQSWFIRDNDDGQYKLDRTEGYTIKGGGSPTGTAELVVGYDEEGGSYTLSVEVAGPPGTMIYESRTRSQSQPIRIADPAPLHYEYSVGSGDADDANGNSYRLPTQLTQLAGTEVTEYFGHFGLPGYEFNEVLAANPNMRQGTFTWVIEPSRAQIAEDTDSDPADETPASPGEAATVLAYTTKDGREIRAPTREPTAEERRNLGLDPTQRMYEWTAEQRKDIQKDLQQRADDAFEPVRQTPEYAHWERAKRSYEAVKDRPPQDSEKVAAYAEMIRAWHKALDTEEGTAWQKVDNVRKKGAPKATNPLCC
jgi:hypothetical protein